MNKAQLKELVNNVMIEESEYQEFFKKALEKAGKSIPSMSDDEKKAFFDKIDAAWDGKGEKNEALVGNQHKLDVDGDGDIEGDDLADLRAGKKADEATTSSAPGEWVAYLSMTKGKMLLKVFDTARGAKQYLSKNVDKLLGISHVESVGIMTKKEWDTKEAKYAVEGVNEAGELPKASIPSSVKSKLDMAIDRIKDSNLTYNQKIQVVGQIMDSLGIDKAEFNKMASKLKGTMESVNEVEYKDAVEKFNMDLIKNSQVERIAKFHKKSVKDVVKALQPYLKVLRYNDKSVKVISIDFRDTNSDVKVHVSQTYKQNESIKEAETFTATNKATGKTSVFKSKDTRDAAVKAGTHAAIKDPNDSGKAKGGVNIFDKPAKASSGNDGFGWGPKTDRTLATSLPKKASELNDKHASVVSDTLNKEAGLDGYADIDDNTGAIRFTASKGDEPTYTLFIGSNEDYGKPNEFRVSFESTYGEDPAGLDGEIDKSFKTPEEAMAFAAKVAKKYKKELEMNDDTNESVNEVSIPQLAKLDAEHLDRHVGGKSEREVRAFVDRVYEFYPKDVRKYMADVFMDYQKNNRTLKYLTTVLRVMHQDIRESVNEGVSPKEMDVIKSAVEAASSFMGVGAELKKIGMKYTFATEPLPIYIIQPTPNNKVAIVNKKYATKPDFVVGDIAVGIMEGKTAKSVNEGRAFINAARKAKNEGLTEFEFNGKKYPVTIKD